MTSGTPFRPFGTFHLAFLLGTPLTAFVLARWGSRSPHAKTGLRVALAMLLAAIGLSWYVVRIFIWHEAWRDALPLEMCDISLWLSVAALLWSLQRLREITFYWAVSGGFMALLTPDLQDPQWSFRSLTFLFGHAALVVAGVYLVRGCGTRLRRYSWWQAWAGLNVYAACVAVIDLALHTDYMFLCAKPAAPTALDYMGPWPYYIVSADVMAAALFYLMFRAAERPA